MATTVLSRFYKQKEELFYINLQYLFFVGLWPEDHWTKREKLLYKIYEITLHALSSTFLIVTGIAMYQNKDDVTVFLTDLDKSLVGYNFVSKVILFVYNRDQLKKLINEIIDSHDKVSDDCKTMMIKHIISITTFTTILVGAFTGHALLNGEMTVNAWMPFDPFKNNMNLILAAQIIAIMFLVPCCFRGFAMQGIIGSMIMYLCDQLISLQKEIKGLEYTGENGQELGYKLKVAIKKHIRLIRYSNTMEEIFKEYFVVQNLAITVELCLNAMMITIAGWEQKTLLASFLCFLGIALLNAYVYCYLGNELIQQSEGISFSAYESSWTSWPLDLQKDLLTMITAAQRPLKMSAGGVAWMSIPTYAQALYNGYSIFAVLSDVVN